MSRERKVRLAIVRGCAENSEGVIVLLSLRYCFEVAAGIPAAIQHGPNEHLIVANKIKIR
jgi:hypothetical protein